MAFQSENLVHPAAICAKLVYCGRMVELPQLIAQGVAIVYYRAVGFLQVKLWKT
jgi:hypothetical protein